MAPSTFCGVARLAVPSLLNSLQGVHGILLNSEFVQEGAYFKAVPSFCGHVPLRRACLSSEGQICTFRRSKRITETRDLVRCSLDSRNGTERFASASVTELQALDVFRLGGGGAVPTQSGTRRGVSKKITISNLGECPQ